VLAVSGPSPSGSDLVCTLPLLDVECTADTKLIFWGQLRPDEGRSFLGVDDEEASEGRFEEVEAGIHADGEPDA